MKSELRIKKFRGSARSALIAFFLLNSSFLLASVQQPINNSKLTSDLDASGHKLLNLDTSNLSLGGTWGSITGTLSAQTDLQNALNAKQAASSYLTSFVSASGHVDWNAIDNKPATFTPSAHTHPESDITGLVADLTSKVNANGTITGATKTKITYDAKGLVTSGSDATTADIIDSLNKRYVTDAQLTVLGNTSGTNTGDQVVPANTTSTASNWLSAYNSATGAFTKSQPTFTDLAAHPTTIGGYGITDFNSLGDARYAQLAAANTYTAAQVVSGASFGLSGNISASGIFGTAGIRYKNVSGTLTDTTSTGTVATAYNDLFGGNTWAATNATTITNAYGAYFKSPVAGTNVTLTNNYALAADSLLVNGNVNVGGNTGSNSLLLDNSANSTLDFKTGNNGGFKGVRFASLFSMLGTTTRSVIDDSVYNNSSSMVKWSSGANPLSGIDTGIVRNAAGVVEFNNGTAGTYRDGILRSIGLGGSPDGTTGDILSSGQVSLLAGTPAAAASSTAGNSAALSASNAVAGTSVAGAAAGGSVNIAGGSAARLTSGNANGGDINLTTGSGIGTGTSGNVNISANANTGTNSPYISLAEGSGATNRVLYAWSSDNGGSGLAYGQFNDFTRAVYWHDTAGGQVKIRANHAYTWSNSTSTAQATSDAGVARNKAGGTESDNGTPGKYGQHVAGTIALQSLATPAASPSAAVVGTAGTTTISYSYTDCQADATCTAASPVVTVTTANATLSSTNKITLTFPALGANTTYRNVYRTATNGTSPTTTGKINSSNVTTTTFDDTGLAGSGVAPDYNKTGQVLSSQAIGALVYNSTSISLANNTGVPLTFDSERYDTDNIHSTTTNTDRLTAQTAGMYEIRGAVEFAASATGVRELFIEINSTDRIADAVDQAPTSFRSFLNVSRNYYLNAGDYVRLVAFQTSGGALNATNSNKYSPEFSLVRLP